MLNLKKESRIKLLPRTEWEKAKKNYFLPIVLDFDSDFLIRKEFFQKIPKNIFLIFCSLAPLK